MRLHIAVLLAVTVASACGKKKEQKEGTKTPPVDKPPPAVARPSDGKLEPLPPLTLAPDPQRPAKVELGNLLYFDKRLSADGSRACYSCHPNEHGTGGAEPVAIGALAKKLTRHSPHMWNVGYQQGGFYWDGRSKTLEIQAKAAWTGGNMGVAEELLEKKMAELLKIAGYKEKFAAAFPGKKVTADDAVAAISEYERTLVCSDTKYDRFAKGDKAALSEAEKRGYDTFMSKGGCVVCHMPPHFSTSFSMPDGSYFNTGVGTDRPEADVDIGRMKVTKVEADWAAFKPPSLRNVAKTAPYFHDGSAATLEDAVKLMAGGGKPNKNLSKLMTDRKLTGEETADLLAFLRALDCPNYLVEPKLP